jgi:integrase/recombinase XerD
MSNKRKHFKYKSPLAPLMEQLVQEKRATGRRYDTFAWVLKDFDRFLCQANIKPNELPKDIVLQWLEQYPDEKASTKQQRIILIRQLARLMIRLGYPAFIPPYGMGPKRSFVFSPRILTYEEVYKVLNAADQLKPNAKAPWRHLVMPELFRLLYSCGFRLSEVLNLRVRDVDLTQGVITVRETKFDKDRLVPPALDVVERLRVYQEQIDEEALEKRTDDAFFFPSSNRQTAWSPSGIYFIFRKLLHQCGIPHPGRGKGPRVHDLRHTFAVHRLVQWYEQGVDLNTKLPLLIAYLGHQDFTGTQKYLHLTAELFPNLIKRMNKQFGGVIPQRR